MKTKLWLSVAASLVAGCGGPPKKQAGPTGGGGDVAASTTGTDGAATGSAAMDGASTAPPPVATGHPREDLIPRSVLFGNPARAALQISPDGKYYSWLAPLDGVLNVFVAPASDVSKARPRPTEKVRPCASTAGPATASSSTTCRTAPQLRPAPPVRATMFPSRRNATHPRCRR